MYDRKTWEIENMIKVYTDGSCLGNPGPAGAGVLIIEDETPIKKYNCPLKELSTNNRAELLATIIGLKWIKDNGYADEKVMLYTDSQYVIKSIQEWRSSWERKNFIDAKGKPVKNQEYMKALFNAYDAVNVQLCWVKGHAKDQFNNAADALAKQAAKIAQSKMKV